MASKRVKLKLERLKSTFKRAVPLWVADVSKTLSELVDFEIGKGKSPVKGVGRFEAYSDVYLDRIEEEGGIIKGTDGKLNIGKRKRPVNLSVSGTMRKSLTLKKGAWWNQRQILLYYKSKFAKYHDGGNLAIPRRPMLPTKEGEEFSRTITKFLKIAAIDAIRRVAK